MHWMAAFLCIFSIGSVSESLDHQPENTIHSGYMQIIGIETKDLSKRPSFGQSSARIGKDGCLTPAQAYRPAPTNVSGEVTASWYGQAHHNNVTASGQKFDMHKNTLAHRTLPLGTEVRLVNHNNGKSAEGVVNDRGPYIKGRDVDLSYAMAKQLGFVKKGVMKLGMKTIVVAGEASQRD